MILRLFDSFVFSILFPVILALMIIFGFWIANRFYKQRNRSWSGSGIENAIIGLYALLLSFTLLLSGNMQKERNTMVHRVADGAAQIKRASFFLPGDMQLIIKEHLYKYLNLQINFYDRKILHRKELFKQIDSLNQQLWSELNHYVSDTSLKKEDIKLLLPLYDQLNSSFYRLAYTYDERIPIIVMSLLIIGSWLIAVLVGFMNGLKKYHHYLVPIIFFVLVSLTIQAIRDLDNPYSGSVRPEYENIANLKDYILKKLR